MKNILLVIFALTFGSSVSKAQTNAMDFTATDCNSQSHNLYTDLNSGKVVVLVWVMPCGSCVNGAKAAYTEVKKFAGTHPGKVVMYLIDDYGNTSCTALRSWATTASVGDSNIFLFDNSSKAINEDNYGGAGMPHVLVTSGYDHKIYFNKLNGSANDPTGIGSAIQTAFTSASVNDKLSSTYQLSVFPNPVKEKLNVEFTLQTSGPVSFKLIDLAGKTVFERLDENFGSGRQTYEISCLDIPKGNYLLQIQVGEGVINKPIVVE